ncbi:MAG: NUDIX domain-containing protein [bacterium]
MKDTEGRFLLIFNTVVHSFVLPGGKIEKGETPEGGMKRECKEEL